MAKTLVIKGTDFTVNALDVVSLIEDKPCTDVSLAESTISLTAIGTTQTLTATLTPEDTTDTLTWTSSDTDVATVNNGVVTAIGLGSATITAICGGQSASCTVSVNIEFSAEWDIGYHVYVVNDNNHASIGNLSSAMYSYSETGQLPLQKKGSDSSEFIYPTVIPYGCKKISITAQDCYIGYIFTNLNTSGDAPGYLGIISWAGASSTGIKDSCVLDVPTGADGINIVIRKVSGNASQSLINDVTVLFLSDQENE